MSELFKLKNGTVLISTEAPGGIYNSSQLKKIAELCSKELAIVKATEDQRLALFVKESEVERVTQELKTTGLGFRNYQSGLHQPVSCLGELCESHDQPALTSAMDLTKLLADLKLQSSLKIGINGCARCCTPCHTLDISVVGEAHGYRISLGGKPSQFPAIASYFAESVPADKLPPLLTKVLAIFQSKAEPGESLSEVLDRCGVEEFVAALAPYSQDAAHRQDPFAVAESGAARDAGHDGEDGDSVGGAKPGVDEDDFMNIEIGEDPSLELLEADDFAIPSPAVSGGTADFGESQEMMEIEFEDEPVIEADDIDYGLISQDSDEGTLDEVPINIDQNDALDDDIVLGDVHSMVGLDSMDDMSEVDPLEEMDAIPEEDAEVIDPPSTPSALSKMKLKETDAGVGEGRKSGLEIENSDEDFEDWEAEAAEVKAALESEGDQHLIDIPEVEMEELDFAPSAAMREDLQLDEADLLDLGEDLEADLPLSLSEFEDIPELDEDLLQSNEIEASPPASAADEFEEIEEGSSNSMSSEEEQNFEQKIQASIEEEKKMRKHIEEDTNRSAREDTLRMLETATEEQAHDSIKQSAYTPPKIQTPLKSSPKSSKSFDFEGFDVTDHTLRVHFSSGAYVDVQLDSLESARSKVIRFGKQAITVTYEGDGYTLEVDGMSMFYPRQAMRVAS